MQRIGEIVASLILAVCAASAVAAPPGGHAEPRLDLRLPEDLAAAASSSEGFPSGNHRGSWSAELQAQLPALGAAARSRVGAPIPSRIGALVREMPREGLPVARLWQSETALFHLGLNQKGKPGLWFFKKMQ